MDQETPTTSADQGQEQAADQVLQDMEQLRDERDKFLGLLQRTRADFENYQKRIQRDLETERKYALTPLVKDLLPALDNLERALAAVKDESPLSKGIALVQGQLVETLKRHHVTRIEPAGQPFDPNLHQAVMEQASPDHPPGTVLQVLQPGYQYHDRVIRPASVVVSKREEG